MKIFGVIGGWIKTHLVVTIIIGVAVVGVVTFLLFNNTSKLDFGGLFNKKVTSEVYLNYGVELHSFIYRYLMFNKSGKVYMLEQRIDRDEQDQADNFEKLVLKYGVDNVYKRCNKEYSYCFGTLGISEFGTGVYTIDNGKVKIEWDSNYKDTNYYRIKDGQIWALNSDLELTDTSYEPVKDYNKWKKCQSDKNCDEVFSIEDPLNDFDFSSLYPAFEKMANRYSRYCHHNYEYAFKDITGDGIDEMLVRQSYGESDWRLFQIYYANTWDAKILPLGDDVGAFENVEISDVYEGGYIYISGQYLASSYYKVSEDGVFLDFVSNDIDDLPSEKSIYEDISDWKSITRDDEYCKIINN